MPTLAELKDKYKMEGGKYEPKPDCKFCKGTGERYIKKLDRTTFCICLFVAPDMSDFAGESLGATAKKLREQMEGKK